LNRSSVSQILCQAGLELANAGLLSIEVADAIAAGQSGVKGLAEEEARDAIASGGALGRGT
jgi:hypothetical protein